jgi:glycosyltransferase involved in cell wall biosynthesis
MKYTTHELWDITGLDFFDKGLDALITGLQEIKKRYPDHTNLRIATYEDLYSEGYADIKLYGDLPETIAERGTREGFEKIAKEKKVECDKKYEIQEKEQLKRLLDKYGDDLV